MGLGAFGVLESVAVIRVGSVAQDEKPGWEKSEIRNKFKMRVGGKMSAGVRRSIFPSFNSFGFVSDFDIRISDFSSYWLRAQRKPRSDAAYAGAAFIRALGR